MSVYQFLYILAAAGFILALKWMSSPATARRGVLAGEAGMLLAIVGTLMRAEIFNYEWIADGIVLGAMIGAPIAIYTPTTGVPQRTAISQACGALASALIGTAEYYKLHPHGFILGALIVETLLGFLTVTASIMAWGKLQEVLPGRPIVYKGQFFINMTVLAAAIGMGIFLIVNPDQQQLYPVFVVLALTFGVFLIMPIAVAPTCADRHCAAEFVRGAFCLRDGFRAR